MQEDSIVYDAAKGEESKAEAPNPSKLSNFIHSNKPLY
jgi:hypothetical protein